MTKAHPDYGKSANKLLRIYKRDKGICWICLKKVKWGNVAREESPTKDHYIPQSRAAEFGMTQQQCDHEDNLRLAHWKCNNARGNQMEDEMWEVVDWHSHPASGRTSKQSYANRPKVLRGWK